MTDVIEATVVETGAVGFRPKLSSIQSRGKSSPYLTVKQRVLWFRADHPEGSIETELVEHEAGAYALIKCTVSFLIPNPDEPAFFTVTCTGYGSETRADFGDYLEKAETKAVGRALAHAGYGTEALDEGVPVDAAPPDRSSLPPAMTSGGASINQQKQILNLSQVLGIVNDIDLASVTADDAQVRIDELRARLAKRG
jgi:hypothetical protein